MISEPITITETPKVKKVGRGKALKNCSPDEIALKRRHRLDYLKARQKPYNDKRRGEYERLKALERSILEKEAAVKCV